MNSERAHLRRRRQSRWKRQDVCTATKPAKLGRSFALTSAAAPVRITRKCRRYILDEIRSSERLNVEPSVKRSHHRSHFHGR